MPPAAATEWERTGWTLLTIATLEPACAAARAARWPARPAPMMSTSCDGMGRDSITRDRTGMARRAQLTVERWVGLAQNGLPHTRMGRRKRNGRPGCPGGLKMACP